MSTSKFPKAARLQQQREAKYLAEQVRQKAEAMLAKENAVMSVKRRTDGQQEKCMVAERAIAKKRKKK